MNDTKDSIQKAFIRLYRKKSYDKMTIKELCEAAPVARTTFYEYYKNLGELKTEIENQLIEGIVDMAEIMCKGDMKNLILEDYFSNVLEYLKLHWDENFAFLIQQPNFEYIRKWKEAIKMHFRMRFPELITVTNYAVISEIIASAVLGAYTYWMEHPNDVDLKKLNEISAAAINILPKII